MKPDERIAARARKNYAEILSALSEVGQSRVAEMLGVSEATISRLKGNGDIELMAALLAALRKKAVDESARYVSEARMHSLCDLAAEGVEAFRKSDSGFGAL